MMFLHQCQSYSVGVPGQRSALGRFNLQALVSKGLAGTIEERERCGMNGNPEQTTMRSVNTITTDCGHYQFG